MTIPATRGQYNFNTGKIYPESTSTWSGLSSTTWDSWKEWAYSTEDSIVWYMPDINLGQIAKNFTLDIETVAEGSVSYKIYTSLTGDYTGEETETIVEAGATNVPSFFGRFVFVVVIVTKTGSMPTLTNTNIKVNDSAVLEFRLPNTDTTELAGSTTGRWFQVNKPISAVTDLTIVPHETSSPYNLDVYVTNTPTSTYLIPKVISKDPSAITFALVGVDNHARDGIVDITVRALPKQYMSGNNLKTQ